MMRSPPLRFFSLSLSLFPPPPLPLPLPCPSPRLTAQYHHRPPRLLSPFSTTTPSVAARSSSAGSRPSARHRPPPKAETRPLSDASRSHLLADPTCSSSRSGHHLKDGDWLCPKCHFLNFASRRACWRCAHAPSPAHRDPIRTSPPGPLVVAMHPATLLGQQVVLVFVQLPGVVHSHEWTLPVSSCCSHHAVVEHNNNSNNDFNVIPSSCTSAPSTSSTQDEDNGDEQFHAHLVSSATHSPISQALHQAHAKGALALLTGDWICPSCSVVNYAFRDACFKCDHEVLDAAAPARRLVVLPHTMLAPATRSASDDPSAWPARTVLLALAKLQGLWQGPLCGAEEHAPAEAAAAAGRSGVGRLWACPHCLFVNRWAAHTCRKCGHDRDGWSRRVGVVGQDPVAAPATQEPVVWLSGTRPPGGGVPDEEDVDGDDLQGESEMVRFTEMAAERAWTKRELKAAGKRVDDLGGARAARKTEKGAM